jgi:hypothetical protein
MKDYGRRAETKLVKDFLAKKGYRNIRVDHGKGTAWGWLHVYVTTNKPGNCFCDTHKNQWGQSETCPYCRTYWQEEYRKIGEMIRGVTGRNGEYGGNVNIDIHLENEQVNVPVVPKSTVLQTILAD